MAVAYTIDLTDPDWTWNAPTEAESELGPVEARELLLPGSLTARVRQLAGSSFQLVVREECWRQLQLHSLRSGFWQGADFDRFWSRKIALRGQGQDWILGHMLLPEQSAVGAFAVLRELQDKPLGEFLFVQPDITWSDFELGRLQRNFDPCRGRRRLFFLHAESIMVSEYFTHAFFRAVEAQDASLAGAPQSRL